MLKPVTIHQNVTALVIALAAAQLAACGSGGSEPESEPEIPVPPVPAVSLTATPNPVDYNSQAMLSWSSTDAENCMASGGWSGERDAAGNEQVGPLTASGSYSLACSGPGGSTSKTVQLSVMAQPALSFSSDRSSVDAGEFVDLTWASTSVDSCVASGDWSGSRDLDGQDTVGPLQSDSAFTLTCSGASATLVETVNISVTQTGGGGEQSLEGAVDSSLVDGEGLNKVYVYAGDVQPDDYDGDSGDPLFAATVNQDPGACTWRYDLDPALQDGLYTVAFTADAGGDNPSANDNLVFRGRATVNVSGGAVVHDFLPANVIRVGPSRPYMTLAQASRAASDGDVVEIDAGVYQDDISIWRQDNVTLRGVNGMAHLKAVAMIPNSGGDQGNGKAIIVVRGDNVRVENLEFSGARVPDLNGAGIRAAGGALTICSGYFHDNEMGILGYGSRILIEYSEFDNNGLGEYGRTHNVYINNGDRFTFRYNYSHHANIGHTLKSRARENHVLYNRLMDEASGTSSYSVDLPNGGLSYVIGNLIQQGTQGSNGVMLSYGTEGLRAGATHNVYVVNNTFVNDRQGGTFVKLNPATASARVTNNLFVGNGTRVNGPAQQTANLQTSSPGFADIDNYEYRLRADSVAIDAGTEPGSGDAVSLTPVWHYVHAAGTEPRIQSGSIDIGAYEYTPR